MVQIKQKRGTGVKTPSPRSFWCGMNEWWHTFERVGTQVRRSHISHALNINESSHACHAYERVALCESCITYKWVMAHIWTSHVSDMQESRDTKETFHMIKHTLQYTLQHSLQHILNTHCPALQPSWCQGDVSHESTHTATHTVTHTVTHTATHYNTLQYTL